MLKTSTLAALAALGLCLGGTATAQVGQRPPMNSLQRPPVSPYLNMLRTGSSPAVNYYGVVRPQQEGLKSIQQLQQQQQQQQQLLMGGQMGIGQQPEDPMLALPVTGHSVSFFNYSRYFPLATGGGATAPPTGLGIMKR